MGRGIGRVCVATCLCAAGACLAGVVLLDQWTDRIEDVACEPPVAAEDVAAVIRWAQSGAGAWRPEVPEVVGADAAPLVRVSMGLPAREGVIAVPPSARAGGGKVSSIPGGDLRIGRRASYTYQRRSAFTTMLNRSMAPASTRRR